MECAKAPIGEKITCITDQEIKKEPVDDAENEIISMIEIEIEPQVCIPFHSPTTSNSNIIQTSLKRKKKTFGIPDPSKEANNIQTEVKIESIDEADSYKDPDDILREHSTVELEPPHKEILPKSTASINLTHNYEVPCSNSVDGVCKVGEEDVATGSDNYKPYMDTANDDLYDSKLMMKPVVSLQKAFIGSCIYCKKEFYSETLLQKHIFNHVKTVNVSDYTTLHIRERTFDCHSCDKKFVSRGDFNKHVRWHAEDKPFKCDVCDRKFILKNDFTMHMRTHTGEKPFKCDTCGKCFIRKTYLTNHIRIHTGERPFECYICKSKFVVKSHLNRHMRTHTGEKPFNKKFASNSDSNVNAQSHTGETLYECDICFKNFPTQAIWNNHVESHTADKPFTCKICSKKFYTKFSLFCHSKTHTGEKRFGCNMCDKRFSTKLYYNKHMKAHADRNIDENITEEFLFIPVEVTIDTEEDKIINTEEIPVFNEKNSQIKTDKQSLNEEKDEVETHSEIYECDLCEKRFIVREAFVNHTKLHKNRHRPKCDICNKTFPYLTHLHRHMSTHTGNRPFPCSLCGKGFSAQNDLNRHVKIHTGERPFKCDICNKAFSTRTIRNNHVQTHSKEKLYKCHLCDKKFTLKYQLTSHNNRFHAGNIIQSAPKDAKLVTVILE